MIECENLTKSFHCGASWERLFVPLNVRALDGLSFRSQLNEPLFIHGPAGSGKSVLLNLLAGFYPPDGGTILVNDRDPWMDEPSGRRMSMVRPGPGDFDPSLSSRRNLRIVAGFYDVPADEAQNRVDEALDFVGINPDEQTVPVGELSNGTQSLISLASALIASPELLLLDEPERFMDSAMFDRHLELVRGLIQQGMSVVVATPKSEMYGGVSGDRLLIEDGRRRDFVEASS